MKLGMKTLQKLKDNIISIKSLNKKYFIDSQCNTEIENILKLLHEDICSFKEITNKFKSIYALDSLLYNKNFFNTLIQNNRLTQDDLEYLLNRIDKWSELRNLNENTTLLNYIVDKDVISFKELVDKCKSIKDRGNNPCLDYLLKNTELFEELIQNDTLNTEDLKSLLNKIDTDYELYNLCWNVPLLKYVLNEFMLNKELVDRFNTITEKIDWCKDRNIHTIFDYIEYFHKNNEEVLKFNELNKKVYSFDLNEDQHLELIELIQDNEIVKNRMIQIIDNKLESNYDFKSLMSCYRLLRNEKLFEELIENNRLNIEDLRYLLNRIDDWYELEKLSRNTSLLIYIVDKNILSFKELVDKCKSISELDALLGNKELFEKLIQSNRLNQEDLKYLLNKIDNKHELRSLSGNIILLNYIVDKNILSFKELVDKFKSIKDARSNLCLNDLLENKKFFEELIKNNRLNKEDLRYLLNKIDREYKLDKLFYELDKLCDNTSLLKHILNEFVLNKELVDKFNTIAENNDWCKRHNIHTLFEYIEYEYKNYKNDEEILELNELNKKVCLLNNFDLNEEQRLEVSEVLRNSEVAQNRLIQIIDNQLEDQFDFDSLMNCLKKPEKKNILNI